MNTSSAKSYIKAITLNEFENKFSELILKKSSFFAYFYGGYDETGVSWCSDCVISKPNVDEASKVLADMTDTLLIKLPIDDRNEWKKQDFIYRIHEKVKVTRVPTLVYYHNWIEFGRLVEDELFDLENVKSFFNQALDI